MRYSQNEFAQDSALGTGSVMQEKDGLYHAFYTGFNWRKVPKEAIMHATSKDLINWTKIPGDKFFASAKYLHNDFRDPHVFYNDDYKEYWMLITTRTKNDKGVIALYTSKDLKNWADNGVFFDNDMGTTANMECPTLIKYGEYWYLTFSDQWPNRVVHYRIAKDSKGPFTKPQLDFFDSNGFYAGKLVKDSQNLYLCGWTPTKEGHSDNNKTDWAGNLVVHQIKQKENGELYPTPVEQVVENLNNNIKLKPITQTETVTASNEKYTFSAKGYEVVTFPKIQGVNKITGKITKKSKEGMFGFMFNVEEYNLASLNIAFSPKSKEVKFFNVSTDKIATAKPELTVPLDVNDNESLNFTLLIDDSVAVLYINDKVALSTRMYALQNNQWGIFSINSDVTYEDLNLSKF
ncbi:glycoside hydrolase family 32 protein [Pelosinus fermentans]|uniref:glycoside hydrolase family 32 protein n=1 Tax=Pelosinus fermentans TaxID=365349 RepID=UPI001F21B4DA|nr:glycoside hydrolase family 32 protein [Pelosinus fermentans]